MEARRNLFSNFEDEYRFDDDDYVDGGGGGGNNDDEVVRSERKTRKLHSCFNYYQKNRILLNNHLLHPIPQPHNIALKGEEVNAMGILYGVCLYSCLMEQELFAMKHSLHLHNGIITYNGRSVTLSTLFLFYLEQTLGLSSGFRALLEWQHPSVDIFFRFFAQQEIQTQACHFILGRLIKHNANRRTINDTFFKVRKEARKFIIKKVVYAYSTKVITLEDVKFWHDMPSPSQSKWKQILMEIAKTEKLCPSPVQVQSYRPWIIVLKQQLQFILQNRANHRLLKPANRKELNKLVTLTANWLYRKERRNLFLWLAPFLFNEGWSDTKRKFLFVKGPPNSGKTFFLNLMFPSKSFCRLNRKFSHFGSEQPGSYELHLLVFDDPGEAKNKMNQIETSTLLNLANLDASVQHAFHVKYGFFYLHKGQVVIMSNVEAKAMFDMAVLEPIKTRLLEIEFDADFPLRIANLTTKPLSFKEMLFNPEQGSFGVHHHQNLNIMDQEDQPEEAEKHDNSVDDMTEDLAFLIIWKAVLRILKKQLEIQDLQVLAEVIPHPKLREYILNRNFDSLETVILETPEVNLLEYVYNKKIPIDQIYSY